MEELVHSYSTETLKFEAGHEKTSAWNVIYLGCSVFKEVMMAHIRSHRGIYPDIGWIQALTRSPLLWLWMTKTGKIHDHDLDYFFWRNYELMHSILLKLPPIKVSHITNVYWVDLGVHYSRPGAMSRHVDRTLLSVDPSDLA